MKNNLILIIILLFGFLLRTVFINGSPPSLYGDELTIVLDANSLLKTGHDQLGNFLPLTFPMGAGRPAGYVYGSIPFIAIFGPTALGVRALSIFSGIGIIILLYLVGKKLFSAKLGLLAAAIAAVSPWGISLSRGGFEAHFALFLALLGAYLLLKAREKPYLYIFSALSLGLTFHTYPTYKVSMLLFLPLFCWFQGVKNIVVNKKYFLGGVIVLSFLGSLALSQTFYGGSEERFSGINIFSQGELRSKVEQKIILERQITRLPSTVSKYLHNKPLEYAKVFIENYLQNFSMDFLILHGDKNPRHNMATMGVVYFSEAVLISIGLLHFWQRQRKIILFLLLWILLAPVPAAIIDLPHALRSSFMMPPLVLLAALGLFTLVTHKSKIPLYIVSTIFVIQFVFFIQKLYFLAPSEYGRFWSYQAKLASEITIANQDQYNYIILSDKIDSIEFAYPAYAKIDPNEIISQNKFLLNTSEKSLDRFKRYGNVYISFIPEGEISKILNNLPKPVLYIGDGASRILEGYELIEGKDKQTALILKKMNE